jgi:hypothetical protein
MGAKRLLELSTEDQDGAADTEESGDETCYKAEPQVSPVDPLVKNAGHENKSILKLKLKMNFNFNYETDTSNPSACRLEKVFNRRNSLPRGRKLH